MLDGVDDLIIPPLHTIEDTCLFCGEYDMPPSILTTLVVAKDADVFAWSDGGEQATASSVGYHLFICGFIAYSFV